jgi:hypothetical protein
LDPGKVIRNSNDPPPFAANSEYSPLTVHLLPKIFADRLPLDGVVTEILDIPYMQRALLIDSCSPLREELAELQPGAVLTTGRFIHAFDCGQFLAWQ